MAEDLVHDAGKRLCCIDDDAIAGRVFSCGVQTQDQIPLALGLAPVIIRTAVEPVFKRFRIDIQDEDFIEEVGEALEISRAAAEEGGFIVWIRRQRPDLFDIPDMLLVPRFGFAAKAFGFLQAVGSLW